MKIQRKSVTLKEGKLPTLNVTAAEIKITMMSMCIVSFNNEIRNTITILKLFFLKNNGFGIMMFIFMLEINKMFGK